MSTNNNGRSPNPLGKGLNSKNKCNNQPKNDSEDEKNMKCRICGHSDIENEICLNCGSDILEEVQDKLKSKFGNKIIRIVPLLLTTLVLLSFFSYGFKSIYFDFNHKYVLVEENNKDIQKNEKGDCFFISLFGFGKHYLEFYENDTASNKSKITLSWKGNDILCSKIKNKKIGNEGIYQYPVNLFFYKKVRIKLDDSCEKATFVLKDADENEYKRINDYITMRKEKIIIDSGVSLYTEKKEDPNNRYHFIESVELIPCGYDSKDDGFWLSFNMELNDSNNESKQIVWKKSY